MEYAKTLKKEHTEASQLAVKLNWLLKDVLWFKIANERQNTKERVYLAAEGVKAGVPDVFIAEARKGYHGLWVELKRLRGGVVSKAQRDFALLAQQRGYKIIFPRGAKEAFAEIREYLGVANDLI